MTSPVAAPALQLLQLEALCSPHAALQPCSLPPFPPELGSRLSSHPPGEGRQRGSDNCQSPGLLKTVSKRGGDSRCSAQHMEAVPPQGSAGLIRRGGMQTIISSTFLEPLDGCHMQVSIDALASTPSTFLFYLFGKQGFFVASVDNEFVKHVCGRCRSCVLAIRAW
jgi:hypothetical protein